ncbi:MAG: PulJ/GspJ family protein [Planctomycetota bacterium]|jgi:hypothetical protein
MKECNGALRGKRRYAQGFTLIEVVIVTPMCVIVVFAVLALLIGGLRSWERGYKSANRQTEIDGQAAATIFGRMGRKSDYDSCEISRLTQSRYTMKRGEQVEFRYWGNKRSRTAKPMAGPTDYAKFYLDKDTKQLKIDYGSYPSGTAKPVIIADNVENVEFSRTMFNKVGHGSVKMKLTLEDPDDGKRITIMAATLMRN